MPLPLPESGAKVNNVEDVKVEPEAGINNPLPEGKQESARVIEHLVDSEPEPEGESKPETTLSDKDMLHLEVLKAVSTSVSSSPTASHRRQRDGKHLWIFGQFI